MNTIVSTSGQSLAMDGQNYIRAAGIPQSISAIAMANSVPSGAEVAANIAQNIADIKESAQQLQKLSDLVMGRRSLRFSVNEELGSVVINVVDPVTDKVIKEIPSAEVQRMKISMKKAMGVLFDEMI